MATLTKSTGTVTLSGTAEKVTLPAAYGWVWVKNMSDADMFAGLSADISEGADGVMVIPSGECGRIQTDGQDSVYLIGSGNALVVAQNYADCPFKVSVKGGESPDLSAYAKKSDIPTELPANGGIAHEVRSPNGKVQLYEDGEGGNFELAAPDGSHFMQMDLYNNTDFRMYFGNKTTGELSFPFYYKFDTGKIEINGDAATVNGHTVEADVPADAKFTDTVPDLTPYALKSKYGDTTINVGRKAGTTVGAHSTAEGHNTTASGYYSHAEGQNTKASGDYSHAEGNDTTASGNYSNAGGYSALASGFSSFAHGENVQALHHLETTFGKHNVSNDDTLFSVGDGTSDSARHNAFEITKIGGKLHDKDILTSAHCIQFIPYNMKYYALNDRILLFSNDDDITRGIYFVNNTPNDITVCALISVSAAGPVVQYGYGSNTYPEIQNTGERREWFSTESIQTSPTIFSMTVPSGKLGYYGLYGNSESAYTTVHDIRCPYFNFF